MPTTLLLNNPPRRNRKGQFVKGAKRTRRRKTTARKASSSPAKRRRRSTTYSNPPAKRRRRRSISSVGGSLKLRQMLPQAAAGVGGYMLTDWGTRKLVEMLPADVTSKIPAEAAPILKGGVAILGGHALSKWGPRGVRKYSGAIMIGGLVSAGLDIIDIARSRGMIPGMSGYWGNQGDMNGYWEPGVQGYFDGDMGERYFDGPSGVYDAETGTFIEEPAVLMDSRDLFN